MTLVIPDPSPGILDKEEAVLRKEGSRRKKFKKRAANGSVG